MPYRFNPDIHHRRSVRLKDYDYSQAGAYFVTICAHNRECLFGEIEDGRIILNEAGRMVEMEWKVLPVRFPHVILDSFVIMPNHIHGVVVIADSEKFVGAPLVGAQKGMNSQNGAGTRPAPTLGDIMCAFKSIATDEYIRGVRERGWQPFDRTLWQRNYYDHVIRSEDDMNKIREYIETNPSGWHEDEENPVKIN